MFYKIMSPGQLNKEKAIISNAMEKYKEMNISLAMSRGIPNQKMIELTAEIFSNIDVYTSRIHKDQTDLGTYNQGLISGIKEIKELFAEILEISEDNLIVGGNSSLNLMFDMFSQLMIHGNNNSTKSWCKEDTLKFICPSPGYDRHFAICEYMGIKMIPVPIKDEGPDMDIIEDLVKKDSSIKGIWCVPLYSNPEGSVYSAKTTERLASMTTAAEDFRIFWDNAYCVHHLFMGEIRHIPNIVKECKKAGNENRAYMFASTSKISIPGSGVSVLASSAENIENILNRMKKQTIGYDKLNMLRHSIAFPDKKAVMEHMRKVADVLRPNFEITLETLDRELGGLDIAEWSNPMGGYFISFYSMAGCAGRIVELCADAGVKLTPAGATFPYKNDPEDRNIRIAPTFPSYEEMKTAAEIFCTCVKYAVLEKLSAEV